MEFVKFHLHYILTILFYVAIVLASHEAPPSPEEYWKSMLPDTSMPNALKQLLPQAYDLDLGDKGTTYVYAYPGGVGVHAGPVGDGTNVHSGVGGVRVDTGGPGNRRSVDVSTDPRKGVDFKNPRGGGVKVHAGIVPFEYLAAADEKDLHDNPTTTLFFMEKDLRPGKKFNVQFVDSDVQAPFISRQEADSIPFSSDSLPEIYDKLSVDPNSAEAAAIRNTLKSCERSDDTTAEESVCATSLESMVDFGISKLGKDIQVSSTDAEDPGRMKEYSVVAVKKMAYDEGSISLCHRRDYAYAMYYCHTGTPTVVYKASMVAGDGSRVDAAASCHQDTSKWNSQTLALQVLQVKPGETSVCHFLPMGDVVWISKQ